ncbi:hypothetical protein INS49_015372 [Diaporthe citri]|uniref:uncharacterized protein n=1 Tax=Diaporthe citri TaxID=83186 RepID=UPI001C81ACEE|nr:uncharacterized protein INS49_015372 [Diaporthe citri]KAG6355987.1 hypothetical protein INS49_015372 [Diaporthe citri]
MSYTGFPPNDFALWISRQVQQGQQGDHHHAQALLNQFSMPQYPLPPSSRAASYPATPQGQIPSATFSNNITGSCPPGPFQNPYPMNSNVLQFPLQLPQAPFPYPGISAPGYVELSPNEYPMGSQQVAPTQGLQQNGGALSYRDPSVPTNLTTIHPSLGLCVLVPIGALSVNAPQSTSDWSAASNPGSRHRDHYGTRVDRLRLRSRELTPYTRHMSPSPTRSFSPYLSSPSSSVTVTPILRHRRLNTPESGRSPRRFHGIGGFTPLRSHDVPRPTIESSISTVGTCSQCGGTGADSSYEPFTDGSVAPTPQMGRDDAVVGRGEPSRAHVEDREGPAGGHRRFQASVEDIDE